jgi:hypothetical protein
MTTDRLETPIFVFAESDARRLSQLKKLSTKSKCRREGKSRRAALYAMMSWGYVILLLGCWSIKSTGLMSCRSPTVRSEEVEVVVEVDGG